MLYVQLLRNEIAMLRLIAGKATGEVRNDILESIARLTDIADTLEGR